MRRGAGSICAGMGAGGGAGLDLRKNRHEPSAGANASTTIPADTLALSMRSCQFPVFPSSDSVTAFKSSVGNLIQNLVPLPISLAKSMVPLCN